MHAGWFYITKFIFIIDPQKHYLTILLFIMFFLLTSILLLVIGLPAALFSAGYGQVYLDYGPLISSVVLILLLMLDLLKHRGRR